MKDRMTARRRTVRTVHTWRLREAETGSRTLDHLLAQLRGALLVTKPSTTGEMIFFRKGSAELDARARASLRDRSAVLRANPGIRIVIGGLASQVGSTADAMGLGLQRVQAIRDFLLSQDIDAARIHVGIRGAEWFLVERPGGVAGEEPSGECRLQIADSHWASSRN